MQDWAGVLLDANRLKAMQLLLCGVHLLLGKHTPNEFRLYAVLLLGIGRVILLDV